MTKIADLLYNFIFYVLKYVGLIFALLLFISALLFSFHDTDITTMVAFIKSDNILTNITGLFVMLSLLFIIHIPYRKKSALTTRILLISTLSFYALSGIFLILFVKSAPLTDSQYVYEIALQCSNGNFEAINPDSYLSVYPHQIGLVGFYEPFLRFWNLLPTSVEGYVFLQYINLFFVLLMLYFSHIIITMIFKDSFVSVCFFITTWLFWPCMFYILRIYGDIPSISLFIVGSWAFISLLENRTKKPLLTALLSIVCFIISIATRKNILIPLVGLIIISAFIILKQKKWRLFILLFLYLIVGFCTLPTIQSLYETRAKNHLDEGTPAITYIYMGTQPGFHANGWYNTYNYNIYVESGHKIDFIRNYTKKKLENQLDYFLKNQKEAYLFYFEKFTSQWTDSTYYSREVTARPSSDRIPLFEKFYSKDGGKIYTFFSNQFQNLLYFGTLIFCISTFFKKSDKNLLSYLCIFIAFLGFIFHMIWEANSRAILAYAILLLPQSAAGISLFIKKLHKFKNFL